MNKYKAKRTIVDGILFASKKEANRYGELKLLRQAGRIHDLELQKEFALEVNGILICKYRSDFTYMENGELVVEDAKGYRTREYRLKKKLMRAVLGISIRES